MASSRLYFNAVELEMSSSEEAKVGDKRLSAEQRVLFRIDKNMEPITVQNIEDMNALLEQSL